MEAEQGYFTIKLQEMNREYLKLQNQLQACCSTNHETIADAMQTLVERGNKDEQRLQQMIDNGHSTLAKSLAKTQLEYKHSVDLHLQNMMQSSSSLATRVDTVALCAEYALDFAMLSMKQALYTVLTAIDLQMKIDEIPD